MSSESPDKEHRRHDAAGKRGRYPDSDHDSPTKETKSPLSEEPKERHRTSFRPHESHLAPRDPNTLYVNKLGRKTREKDLEEAFGKFGPLGSVKIIKDPMTQVSRGYGFIEFKEPDDAQKAIAALDGSDFMDSRIMVELSRRRRPPAPRDNYDYLGKRPRPDYAYDRQSRPRRSVSPSEEDPDRRRREQRPHARDGDRRYARYAENRRPEFGRDYQGRRHDDSRPRYREPVRRADGGDYPRQDRPQSFHDQPRQSSRPRYRPSRSPSPHSPSSPK